MTIVLIIDDVRWDVGWHYAGGRYRGGTRATKNISCCHLYVYHQQRGW